MVLPRRKAALAARKKIQLANRMFVVTMIEAIDTDSLTVL